MELPLNCPLTPERFARLHPDLQTSKTAKWIKNPHCIDAETLDRINASCNHAALSALAPFYFTQPSLNLSQGTTEDQPSGQLQVNSA